MRDQSPRPERRIVMREVQFSLSGHRISRPGLDGGRAPQSPRGIHRSRGPVMSAPIRPGKVTWPRAPSRSSHFPTPSGPTAQTRSPPPPRRCPRRPESLQEVRSWLQPTVHVHTAAHDHGLVVVDPLDLFHRQHVRPRGPPRTDRARWFGRSHQLTRARSRRRPAPAGAESSMATLCPWLHNAASAQLPVGLNALDQEPLGSVSRDSALRGQLEESPSRCWPGGRARWRGRSLSQHVARSSSRRPPCRTAAG